MSLATVIGGTLAAWSKKSLVMSQPTACPCGAQHLLSTLNLQVFEEERSGQFYFIYDCPVCSRALLVAKRSLSGRQKRYVSHRMSTLTWQEWRRHADKKIVICGYA